MKVKHPLSTIPVQLPDRRIYNLPCANKKIHRTSEIQKLFPDLPGIYFYIDSMNIVQYVGVTSKLNSRPVMSHTFGYWEEIIAFFSFTAKHRVKVSRKTYSSQEKVIELFQASPEIYYIEHLCIEFFNPQLNKIRYSKYT